MVRGTFSPARAWRPAVGAPLARTLGFTKSTMRHSSRKCGSRREREQPRGAIATGPLQDAWTRSPRPRSYMTARNQAESLHRSAMRSTPKNCQRFAGGVSCQSVICRESVNRPPPPVGHGLRSAPAMAAERPSSRRLEGRRTPGTTIRRGLCPRCNLAAINAVKPNPSFKPSPNGGPPGPVWRYAVHFRQPGPGVPPSVPS